MLRVAAAGHLHIPNPKPLQRTLPKVLAELVAYAGRVNERFSSSLGDSGELQQPDLRILCQLASGVDQMAAATALDLGYSLHAVLPGSRESVKRDISRQKEQSASSRDLDQSAAVVVYQDLLDRATRVLELDPPTGRSGAGMPTTEAYAQATSIILEHSDIVLIVIHDKGSEHPGGTKWMEQRSEELNLPIIRVPIDNPTQATLIWTTDGRRESRHLFKRDQTLRPSVFEAALNRTLLNQASTFSPYKPGWFEDRMINQFDPAFNAQLWDDRWKLPNTEKSLADNSLGPVVSQIDEDLRQVKVWADHRASALANMVRGSFIVCALLGSIAVAGAVAGLIYSGLSKSGKMLEIACLLVILLFIRRSTKWNWRAQWLSLRQLERSIEQAAWLLTLGRTPTFTIPAHELEFQGDPESIWTNLVSSRSVARCLFS